MIMAFLAAILAGASGAAAGLWLERRDAAAGPENGETGAPGGAFTPWRWLHPLVMGGGAFGLALSPAYVLAAQEAPAPALAALVQVLLLWLLAYALAWIDFRTLEVPSLLVVVGLLLRLAMVAVFYRQSLMDMLLGAAVGAGLLYLVGFFYHALRGREGLGDGDPAVLALMGAFVGWQGLLPVMLLATASGILAGLLMLRFSARPWQTPVPFVPFLCAAGLAVYVAQSHGWSYL